MEIIPLHQINVNQQSILSQTKADLPEPQRLWKGDRGLAGASASSGHDLMDGLAEVDLKALAAGND